MASTPTYCYKCPHYCDWMNTNVGYCDILATTVFGDELCAEQDCCIHDEL